MLHAGSSTPLTGIRAPKTETEICLTLGSDLVGPDVTADRARAAVAAVAPAFEITEQRLPAPLSDFVNVATDLGQWGIVVGVPHDPGIDLRQVSVRLFEDDQPVDAAVATQDVVDDPYLSPARICRELSRFGHGLAAGQHVITGALVRFPPVVRPGTLRAVFDPVGEVSVTFG